MEEFGNRLNKKSDLPRLGSTTEQDTQRYDGPCILIRPCTLRVEKI